MSTVILLSSSPLQVFARSPTPADSSSPLPSTATLLQGDSPGRRKFKTRSCQRDGFQASFTTARQVLAEKNGAENAIISTPGRNRFRSSQDDTAHETKEVQKPQPASKPVVWLGEVSKKPEAQPSQAQPRKKEFASLVGGENTSVTETGLLRKNTPEPLLLERAVARKLDWSPPKCNASKQDDEKPVEYSAGYMNGMLSNFNYVNEHNNEVERSAIQAHHPVKRRRIDTEEDKRKRSAQPVPSLHKLDPLPKLAATKRNRSPPKKALTITSLATSNYLGENEVDEGPLMQYLTSTQAQLEEVPSNVLLEVKVQKTRAAVRKLKDSKKVQPKSLLLSPKSAMKTHEEQDTIFGSASQLAREESPNFLRETIQAMKESESFLMSDPFSSPQRTQQRSVENTPQAGITKFRKTRNLWAAAGRDEDNALLHVDIVDLTDTPAVRDAFAGKDVLLQPSSKGGKSVSQSRASLRGGCSPLKHTRSSSVIDIADIITPNNASARALSTTAKSTSPRRSPGRTIQESGRTTVVEPLSEDAPAPPPPHKPNYAGLTVHELNKHIKAYGFKAMRKREKMIGLLDRCWEEKYGPTAPPEDTEPETVPFGDFLSKVHDLSARPEPKVKKPRVRKKNDEAGEGSKEKPVRKPRKKKELQNQAEDGAVQKPKQPRKRKSKNSTEESALDIDSIWNTIPEELRALEAFDDWAKPAKKPKTKKEKQPASITDDGIPRPPTPPATNPVQDSPASSIVEEQAQVMSDRQLLTKESVSAPALTPPLASVSTKITSAIVHQSQLIQPGRNHNTNPTWHEKVLLYDPIILEDLAAWLNTEGLSAIGEDREVSALDVREWCEGKGICCLWRGGWRGNKAAQS